MYVRRRVAFAALLIISLAILAPRGARAETAASGTITIYFDSDHTQRALTDLTPGTPAAFYVVAENVAPEGLAGFTFGVEVDESTIFLGLTPVAGSAVQLAPLAAGGTRFEAYAAPGACIAPNENGRVVLAEGILIWLGPGPNGETIVDLSGAVRVEPDTPEPTWFVCGTGSRTSFATVLDGSIGPSGGPVCQLSDATINFGNVRVGTIVARTITITNVGGGSLKGTIASSCGGFTVTSGSGHYSLDYGQTHEVTVQLTATSPGTVACALDTGTDCGTVALGATVVDPAAIGDPAGSLAIYLDPALTQRVAVNQDFGSTHSFYVTAEDLPPGAKVYGFELAVSLDGFLVVQSTFNPPGAEVTASGGLADYIVVRGACPTPDAAGRDLLLELAAPMVIPSDDYTSTITATGSSLSSLGLGAAPVWVDCDGTIHPFATIKGARIEYVDPYQCVRGPSVMEFGRVFTGDQRTQTFTLFNEGDQPAAGSLSIDCSAFTIVAGADYNLAPGETHDVTVRFAPLGSGEYGCALSGGPMCDPVLLSGRGSAPRAAGAPEGTIAIFFDEGSTQTVLTPDIGQVGELHVVASDFNAGALANLDGFELTLQLPGDILVVAGDPFPHNIRYDADGNQAITLLVAIPECAGSDAQGRVELATLQFIYLPLFPRTGAIAATATPIDGSLFTPPAPGWTECGGDAHAFAAAQGAVVYPANPPAPAPPASFTRVDQGNAVSLYWGAQADAAGHRLFRGETPDFVPSRATLLAEFTGTSYVETVPDPSRYYYKLSAVDVGGVGSPAVATNGDIVAVAITAFDARATAAGVELAWDVFADEAFAGFRVYRTRDDGPAALVSGTLPVHTRRYTDTDIAPGASYTYTLAALMRDGVEMLSAPARVSTAPAVTALTGNYPNPFNPSTTVAFSLATTARVRVDVFDIAGHRVATLADGTFPAGPNHVEWDGRNRAGTPSASGVYFVRFEAPGVRQARKITLLK